MLIGETLGGYRVLEKLGEGGMGEVYRARDTKLNRDVAIKVLLPSVANDPERLARFRREAQVLASLNHPNIAAIYGLEEGRVGLGGQVGPVGQVGRVGSTENVPSFLVLELVEGPTLADRIAHGALLLSEALPIARQIAEALGAAHEQGIIHRDLKPANIKLKAADLSDCAVKVLDFGLAKALDPAGPPNANLANSPTLSMQATQAGVILGTAAYMSPEQARGRPVDKRSDLWAFGAVLYEMLTGVRAFHGEDVSETLAFALTKEPDWTRLPSETPQSITKLLRRCLQKERMRRLESASDARLEIEDALSTSISDVASATVSIPPRGRTDPLAWIAAALFAIVAVAAVWAPWRTTKQEDRPLMRYSIDLGSDAVVGPNLTVAVSPDGRRLVFPVRGPNGTTELATRLLDQATPTMLRGTEGAEAPFFSPDGAWVGFFAGSKLKKVSFAGGAPVVLCDAGPFGSGASWGEDGTITASLPAGLFRVSADGGTPEPLTNVENGGFRSLWPQRLPGGKAVLFTAYSRQGDVDSANIQMRSLDTGQTVTLVRGGYFGRYVASAGSTGHLLYVRSGTLYAAALNPLELRLGGPGTPLLDDIASNPSTLGGLGGQFDASPTGTLYYRSGGSEGTYPVLWLDRSGTKALLTKPGAYFVPRFSPDGRRLALHQTSEGRTEILVYDWEQDRLSRLTTSGQVTGFPVWAPDGKHLVFSAPSPSKAGGSVLVWMNADGGEEHRLFETNGVAWPFSFSPDGRRLAYQARNEESRFEIWTLSLDTSNPRRPGPGQTTAFVRNGSSSITPAFSPDGRWIAYGSDESGRIEVYVRPSEGGATDLGGKWQVSTDGGAFPIWSRDSRQLFFLPVRGGRLMVVDIAIKEGALSAGAPRTWADVELRVPGALQPFDLHPDGKRVAMFPVQAAGTAPETNSVHVTVLLNFFDELRRRVPVGKQ